MFLHHFICSVHFPTVQKHTGFETIPHLYWKNDKGVKPANGFQPAFSGHPVIMSQRENGFRVNSRAKGSTNAARQAIRIQSLQGGHPGSINGIGSHVLEAILLPYSKPRGYRSRHFTLIHELSFTVGIWTRFLSTIKLNTKSYIVLLDTGLKSPECCVEL